MINFIKYLEKKYYIPYEYNWKLKRWVKTNDISFYSTLQRIDIKLSNGINDIYFGLNEVGHPPTLIYPRPKNVVFDKHMDRIFEKYSYDEIYTAILNNNELYVDFNVEDSYKNSKYVIFIK